MTIKTHMNIVRLANEGKTAPEIEKETGTPANAVRRICKSRGVKIQGVQRYIKDKPEIMNKIRQMREDGYTLEEICRHVGFSRKAVKNAAEHHGIQLTGNRPWTMEEDDKILLGVACGMTLMEFSKSGIINRTQNDIFQRAKVLGRTFPRGDTIDGKLYIKNLRKHGGYYGRDAKITPTTPRRFYGDHHVLSQSGMTQEHGTDGLDTSV